MLGTKKFGSVPVGRQGAEPDGFGEIERSSNTSTEHQEQLTRDLASVRRHLEYRGEANIVIAEWRDELRRRIRLINLKAEVIGITAEEHAAIVGEVGEFKRLCAAIGWSPSGRRRS